MTTHGPERLERFEPEAWWSRPASELLETLGVREALGLASERVAAQRERYGANEMGGEGATGLTALLWESLTSPMMLLLLAVAGISLLLGKTLEAIVMAFVVISYVGVELYNKARSDRTMARLREIQAPRVSVLRDGERREIKVEEVVVGDVLPLQPGTRIPADGRLLSSAGLFVNEAPLTGESEPRPKDAGAEVPPDAELAERPTAVFAGTTVIDGQGKALVVAVGSATALGRVAELTAGVEEEPTPLQQEMKSLARTLAYVAVGVSLLIPLVGLLQGQALEEMILTWLALTFLMVPGQPPIIITMALALAAFELAQTHVVVSRLRGAETLGSVTTVLSDKTGTLTENEMTLTALLLGDGTQLEWEARDDEPAPWQAFLKRALPAIPEGSQDPTDAALLAAGKALELPQAPEPGRLVDQVGFARGGTYRSLTYEQEGERRAYVAGQPAFILEQSVRWQREGEAHPWEAAEKEALREQLESLAAAGRRVVAYAWGQRPQGEEAPQELCFAGAVALEDPVRAGVPEAIARLERAGVRTLVVTGDSPATARRVADEVGLDASRVFVGRALQGLEEAELEHHVREANVFARVTPEQKLRLAQALQRQGEVIAVTGDGVNDAPALRAAHIGVAMGLTGTDVAREAADLVLTDDNFSHLPEGVAIGRKAYENFRKGITYYLSAKAILLTAFLVPLAIGYPFPFAPIQIIAIELLMDLASSTIFLSEAAEPGLLQRPPRRKRGFLSWEVAGHILRNLAGPTLALLVAYFGSWALGYGETGARTAAFSTWLLGHIVLALTLKQERISLFERGLFANRFATGWLAGMIALVLALNYLPFVRTALQTQPLAPAQWALVLGGALVGGGWLELLKPLARR